MAKRNLSGPFLLKLRVEESRLQAIVSHQRAPLVKKMPLAVGLAASTGTALKNQGGLRLRANIKRHRRHAFPVSVSAP
jgi:hypothetical protein